MIGDVIVPMAATSATARAAGGTVRSIVIIIAISLLVKYPIGNGWSRI